MEQINVNMIPNGEVKTIHCSKGDGKTRKWGFELYKEDGVIDASSISPQMFFDSYKGGTEQILPENTSVPTTSPIIADIQYKDALRSEQEFLYRESPATVDGKAKITKIKGNTVKFNQLAYIPTGTVSGQGRVATFDGTNKIVLSGTQTTVFDGLSVIGSVSNVWKLQNDYNIIQGHKYLLKITGDTSIQTSALKCYISKTNAWGNTQNILNEAVGSGKIFTIPVNNEYLYFVLYLALETSANNGTYYSHLFDLTAIFGSGNEPTSISDFEAWLSNNIGLLPYYAYTTGKLLPFKGEELKTVGFNQWNEEYEDGVYRIYNSDGNGSKQDISGYTRTKNLVSIMPNTKYYLKKSNITNDGFIGFYDNNQTYLGFTYTVQFIYGIGYIEFTAPPNAFYCSFYTRGSLEGFCLNIWDSTLNGKYEPYTSSTINLSVLERFPTGMKDCSQSSQVFDEMTENEAITRVGSVTFDGSVDGAFYSRTNGDIVVGYTGYKPSPNNNYISNIRSVVPTQSPNGLYNSTASGIAINTAGRLDICIAGLTTQQQLKSYLASNPLTVYYELATPTETTINTASLVSEQAEIPLYEDDDILIGECTTQLSSKSGFIPTKIKYQDDTGVAYSQKINLHVEK